MWTFGEGRKILLVLGFELQTVHAVAYLPFRLRYPGSTYVRYTQNTYKH